MEVQQSQVAARVCTKNMPKGVYAALNAAHDAGALRDRVLLERLHDELCNDVDLDLETFCRRSVAVLIRFVCMGECVEGHNVLSQLS